MKNLSSYKVTKRLSIILMSVIFILPVSVYAFPKDRGIPSQIYQPSYDSLGFLNLESPETMLPFSISLIMGSNFSLTPMVLDFTAASSDSDKNALRYQSAFDFIMSMSIGKNFQLSMYQPFYHQGLGMAFNRSQEWGFIFNDPYNTSKYNPPKSVPGDTRLFFKYRLFDKGGFHSSFGLTAIFPFGVEESFAGEHDIAFKPALLIGWNISRYLLLINLGYLWRNEFEIKDPVDSNTVLLASGPEVHTSVGLKVKLNDKFSIATSFIKYIPLSSSENTDSPHEVQAGVLWHPSKAVTLQISAGTDANTSGEYGRGTPFRVGAYLYWYGGSFKKTRKVGDSDKDGISDDKDMCPNQPEDKDSFEDGDGCPDPDNDMDGIPDKTDKCPNQPEDEDGYEDGDGCPDSDNDMDGILDSIDRCPGEDKDKSDSFLKTKEDKDNFEDEDGCPDPDNDNDGIPDRLDKCPLQKETVNGIDDTDGCPDVSKGLTVKGGKILLKGKISFEKGKMTIKKSSCPVLLRIADFLKSNTGIRLVRIEGHTDNRGRESTNLYLSTARAAAVRQYLISKGVAPLRLQAVGYGSRFPIKPNTSEKNRKANRRVEFIIVYQ